MQKTYFFRISEKLNNPNTSTKSYWSLIKNFNKWEKKYLAFLQFMIIIDMSQILKRNANFSIFTFQNNALKNISTLPNTCSKHTNNILDPIIFSKEDIYKIIKNLDPNKARGRMISIRMIKLCGISICKPVEIIFQNCLRSGKFSSEWKKANVPTFKRGGKQCIKNYRPIYGKMFERLLYNSMFSFFQKMT